MAVKKITPKDESKETVFAYDGHDYAIPDPKLWPLEAQELEESGKPLAALRLILGEAQYKQFKKVPRNMGDIEDFMNAIYEAMEIDKGE
jgi:hypothetical protein